MYQQTWDQLNRKNKKKQEKTKNENSIFNPGKILFIFSLVIIIISLTAFSGIGEQPDEYNTVTVESGQTLWQIASNNYSSRYNLRKIIFEIREINNLDDVVLKTGQEIKLPIKN